MTCRGKVKLLKWSQKALRSSYAIVFNADPKTTLFFELGLTISENFFVMINLRSKRKPIHIFIE